MLEVIEDCNLGPCPLHCTTSKWSTWSACTEKCGGGLKKRIRRIESHAQHGGFELADANRRAALAGLPRPVEEPGFFQGKRTSWDAPLGEGRRDDDPLLSGIKPRKEASSEPRR